MKAGSMAADLRRSPAQQLYRQVCSRLRPGAAPSPRPELSWCSACAVDAVALALDAAPGDNILELWLSKSARRGDIPRRQKVGGRWVTIVTHPHDRPQVQSARASNLDCDADSDGTISCIVRDRLHHDRYYVLSCGHVLAGNGDARKGDRIELSAGDRPFGYGVLEDWAPVLGEGVPRVGVDAGIARISSDLIEIASPDRWPFPAGVSSSVCFDQMVLVKAGNSKRGRLKTRWSGYLDMPDTDRREDYYLENAIGYRAEPETEAGDSGAAVWTEPGDLLIGIHVGAPVGDERWRSNAILCPIDKIMEWFDVEPVLSGGRAYAAIGGDAVFAARATAPPPIKSGAGGASAPASGDDIDVIAMTLWGEARGEGEQGMRAVACVIGNRTRRKWQGKIGYAAICRARWQFSCWNENDPNRNRLEAVRRAPDSAFRLAATIASELVRGQLDDFTFGATHYFAASMRQRPKWALKCLATSPHWRRPSFAMRRFLRYPRIFQSRPRFPRRCLPPPSLRS